jgi:hypothetical protein
MQQQKKPAFPELCRYRRLVPLITQIRGQALHRIRASLREDVFGVVGDDKRLIRAGNNDSCLSLF